MKLRRLLAEFIDGGKIDETVCVVIDIRDDHGCVISRATIEITRTSMYEGGNKIHIEHADVEKAQWVRR